MKTLKKLVLAITVISALAITAVPVSAATDPCAGASENSQCNGGPSGNTDSGTSATPVAPDPNCNNSSATDLQNCLKHNKIITDLNDIIDFLSAGVAVVVIGSIILGGIQYSMANGSPEAVSKAKARITNALIAFAVFLFIFAFLQWIIPGGL